MCPRDVYGLPQTPKGCTTHKSVTHPMEADATFLMYLYNAPLVAFKGGAFHAALRLLHSSSLIFKASTLRVLVSMRIWSPSCSCSSAPQRHQVKGNLHDLDNASTTHNADLLWPTQCSQAASLHLRWDLSVNMAGTRGTCSLTVAEYSC